MRTLLSQYDVRFVFDDTPVLTEGAKLESQEYILV